MRKILTIILIMAVITVFAKDAVVSVKPEKTTELIPYKLSDPIIERIIGGEIAKEGAYPFMTALVIREFDAQFCGGALIAPQWVLTAAHCVKGMTDWDLTLDAIVGIHDLTQTDGQGQRVEVAEIFIHPDYILDHDVALLRLVTPIDTVEPLRLATTEIMAALPVGFEVMAIGWGTVTGEWPYEYPTLLHEVLLPIVDQAVCQAAYDDDGTTITDSMICLGPEDGQQDTCFADSGSPVLAEVDGIWYEMALVSFGGSAGCAAANEYGVYMRMDSHENWIKSKLTNLVFDVVEDFGAAAINTPFDIDITLVNNNTGTVTFSNAAMSGDSKSSFSITGDSCTGEDGLLPGESCSFAITIIGNEPGKVTSAFTANVNIDGEDTTILVEISGFTLGTVDLGIEVDNDTLTFWSGGDGVWEADFESSLNGGSSARSPAILDDQISYLMTTVEGPGQFIFGWKSSTENYFDELTYYLDDNKRDSISGETDWADIGVRIPSGSHTIWWAYEKDSTVADFDDTAYIDWISYTQEVAAPVDGVDGLDGKDGEDGGSGAAGILLLALMGMGVLARRRRIM